MSQKRPLPPLFLTPPTAQPPAKRKTANVLESEVLQLSNELENALSSLKTHTDSEMDRVQRRSVEILGKVKKLSLELRIKSDVLEDALSKSSLALEEALDALRNVSTTDVQLETLQRTLEASLADVNEVQSSTS
jgi:hypothetical protein